MRSWTKSLLIISCIVLLIGLSLVGPIDRTPLTEQSFFKEMIAQLDTFRITPSSKHIIQSGWSKVSITPNYVMPMAGYRMRDHYEGIHDSLYARIVVLHIDNQPIYLISVDLLLFPSALKEKLLLQLKQKSKVPFLYLSATHTHNGLGGWHDTAVGNIALGNYNPQWIEFASQNITNAIQTIESDLKESKIGYWQSDAHEYAENRLVKNAPHDGILRGIKLERTDSSTAQLITFSAHATNISKHDKNLSGDYPAALIDSLNSDTQFNLFMAGMVGSHRLAGIHATEYDALAEAGSVLSHKIQQATISNVYDSVSVFARHIAIRFGPSQLRISKNLKLRDWVFRRLVNPLQGELTYLQLNDIVLIGTPCDFSGEVYVNHIAEIAAQQNKEVIITSFNGEYAGYITEDAHYETEKKEEVMTLNWVGPYYGNYFAEMINKLLSK
jgi:neutral ceramidase